LNGQDRRTEEIAMHQPTACRTVERRDVLAGLTGALIPVAVRAQPVREAPGPNARSASPFDLERFVEDCRSANRDADAQRAVEDVLTRAIESPSAVLAALGAPQHAGIQPLYRSAELTILNIVWAPLMQLMPHEHRMWAVSGIYTGREDNILWRRAGGGIAPHGAVSFARGEVISMPENAIHSVANPTDGFTGAIHIYGGDFFAKPRSEWDPGTHAEQPWSLERAQRIFAESNARFRAVSPRACD
jgi:predicted metal-dependent enzyme (double-stranded beta helix superfamily)